jgi:hypothetical protein
MQGKQIVKYERQISYIKPIINQTISSKMKEGLKSFG